MVIRPGVARRRVYTLCHERDPASPTRDVISHMFVIQDSEVSREGAKRSANNHLPNFAFFAWICGVQLAMRSLQHSHRTTVDAVSSKGLVRIASEKR